MKAVAAALAVVCCFLAAFGDSAMGAPACPDGPPEVRTLLSGQGVLESVIVDGRGRLFFTNGDSLLRLDRPGDQPRRLVEITDPGGLALDVDGTLIVGYGNSAANGSVGDATGPSGLLRVDPDSGASEVYATGLSMANGLDRGPDGSFYASNDFGSNIDRIRNGQTERGWAKVESGNGLVVDSSGRYLYVAQTFRPAAIQRVDLTNPANVTDYVRADAADVAAGLDGMARDDQDRLFVTANGAGELWRVDRTPSICVLLDGLDPFPQGPSAVATGKGSGPFPAGNLYVVTFGGDVIELVGEAAVGQPRPRSPRRAKLRLSVRPRQTEAGRRTRFVFRTTAFKRGRRRAVARAQVRFAGRTVMTNRRGRAVIVRSFRRPGQHRARARKSGFRPGTAVARILAHRQTNARYNAVGS